MVTVTPDGKSVLVANESEPEGYCEGQVDPVGSITIVDLRNVIEKAKARTAWVTLQEANAVGVTEPASADVVGCATHRDFSGDAEAGTAGDLGPEGLHFVTAEDSPTGEPLLIVGNEVSGTTTIWQVEAPGV